jgi:two-component system alkaline phosphatase synthesis response regulator PhoP
MTEPAYILVVEDEAHLADGIRENLEAEGHTVVVAEDGEQGLETWRTQRIDLIILDVMLPRRDGFSVCKAIRGAGGREPILFLTAKNSDDDRVRGLEAGGDDYLGKPFHLKELLLRVSAMLRRQAWYTRSSVSGAATLPNGHRVDFNSYTFVDRDGQAEVLSQKEVMILKMLVERPGQVVSREDILDTVWGYDVFPSTRTVDNFIVRLRKRIESDPAQPRYIHTVRGVGYRYTPDGEE